VDLSADRHDHRLAGVCPHGERVGEIAVEALVGHLQQNLFGLPDVPTTTLVEGSWVTGRTLPALRVAGPWEDEVAGCPPFLGTALPASA
jgi:LacI family transcriptional regulator